MSEEKQEKDPGQLAMERNAEELDRQIVRFTNIDKESFTHSYRGISTTIQRGASQIMRLPEADHLATHLARKILSREKKGNMTESDKQKGINLWSAEEIYDLKAKILSPVAQETSERMSPEEAHKRDQENLQDQYGGTGNSPEPEKAESPPLKPTETKDILKKDVIKELENRGQTVDASKTKEELLKQLMELEARGE